MVEGVSLTPALSEWVKALSCFGGATFWGDRQCVGFGDIVFEGVLDA
jgi:hypothetical protein